MEKVTTIAVIQARMGSTRFPGKVLKHLRGKPVLWHIIYRLRKSKRIDKIIIATSCEATDDAIEEFCKQNKVHCIRGSESDVLGRFELAIKKFECDYIVRVTGDAPLVDPNMIDILLDAIIYQNSDYCTGEPGVPCIHEGFCVFSRAALEKILFQYRTDPTAVEHVTGFIKINPELFEITHVPMDKVYQFENAKISIDTPSDLEFLEALYSNSNAPAGEIEITDVVKLLKSNPELLKINSHVHQKKSSEISRHAIFRCDGSSRIGLGHVLRCLALAEVLRDSYGWGITFALIEGKEGAQIIKEANYHYELAPDKDEIEEQWLDGLINIKNPDVLILDIRTNLPRKQILKWRANGLTMVAIDDPSERKFAVDLAFYPPVPQLDKIDINEFSGELYKGFDYVLLNKEFYNFHHDTINDIPVVLITMGGSDPKGLTLLALKSLNLLDEMFHAKIVLGPGFLFRDKVESFIKDTSLDYEILKNVKHMPSLMANSDIAITSFGMTSYELALIGVPAIYLCLTDDHEESASLFSSLNFGINLGIYDNVSSKRLAEEVKTLLINKTKYNAMFDKLQNFKFTKGADVVASIISKKVTGGKEKEMARS